MKEVKGADGYVSLEVSPFLALDAEGTAKQAELLWKQVDRENVMIKIPGTKPGLKAIRASIGKGININVTLLFGLERYEEVTEAYISGLEDHLAAGHNIEHISSVASFFLSRIDVVVDPLITRKRRERPCWSKLLSRQQKKLTKFTKEYLAPTVGKL
jgi:transaldolase